MGWGKEMGGEGIMISIYYRREKRKEKEKGNEKEMRMFDMGLIMEVER